MALNSYRDLAVWQKSVALVCNVYDLTSDFPKDERFGVTGQLRRAAVSIPSNIAEGYGRETRGEYLNHLSVAGGSANELETLCLVCQRLGLAQDAAISPIITQTGEVQRMLSGLRSKLRRSKND